MRLVRGLAGTLLWIVACLLGLVAVVLCVTLILLPLGLPLLNLARRLFAQSARLFLPRELAHPVKEARGRLGRTAKDATPDKKSRKRLAQKVKKRVKG